MNLLQKIEAETYTARLAPGADQVRTGDNIRVHAKIIEGDKARVQIFEGMVIRIHRGSARGTITVRKVSNNVGVERIFPMCSPNVGKFEVITRHKVRRAKLHFLRARRGKAAASSPSSSVGEPGASRGHAAREAVSRGQAAESWVAERLIDEGWVVLDRNWRGANGELDLVVERAGRLRFVEVKAREPGDDSGLESIVGLKQARLVGAAEAWLDLHSRRAEAAFMVAVVTFGPPDTGLPPDPAQWRVEWWDDAF